jgi:alpha-tubulin suppressor-like RCC1 family protein
VAAGGLATFAGKVSGDSRAVVVVQGRSGGRWVALVRGRSASGGRFSLTWIVPGSASTVRVRAVVYQGARVAAGSVVRRLVVRKAKGKVVVVSPKARVLSASTLLSAPAPGQPGVLRYSGGNQVSVGQIIAIGPGPATPEGFLGQVTGVSTASGAVTVVSTVPATLMQAIPTGSFDQTLTQQPVSTHSTLGRALRRAEDKTVTCQGSGSASISANASVGVSIVVKGSWSILHGVQSASLTGSASAQASVTATVEGQGSCTLNPVTIADLMGPQHLFFIGPIPVYITSDISVDVDASASVDAKLTTGISAGYSAEAGVGWTKNGGFYPIETFGPSFKYTPPTLTAGANVQADVTPTIQVSVDGGGHANLGLKAGLDLNANTAANPWWTLTAPVALTADLTISKLDLQSPTLDIYQHTFTLAHASGPFNSSGTGGGGSGGSGSGGGGTGGGVGGGGSATAIATGGETSCAVLAAGGVDCWGITAGGGDSGTTTTTASDVPVPVSVITDATAIATGLSGSSCAVLATGGVDCWGDNTYGELGDGTMTDSTVPVHVSGITNATAIAAGGDSACAVLTTGGVDCWGHNIYGELGDGTTTDSDVPVPVSGITNATAIATGGSDSACAILATGGVDCWGNNGAGELGDGTTTGADTCNGIPCSTTPVPASGITNATAIATDANSSCVALATGGIDCWGGNLYGQLGNGSATNSDVPVPVSGITNATAIATGDDQSSCAVLATGGVDCWGYNNSGELGDGTTTGPETCLTSACSTTPVPVSGITDATATATGLDSSCAVLETGGIDCWGGNTYGELGNGTKTSSDVPVPVSGIP